MGEITEMLRYFGPPPSIHGRVKNEIGQIRVKPQYTDMVVTLVRGAENQSLGIEVLASIAQFNPSPKNRVGKKPEILKKPDKTRFFFK